MTTTTLLSGSYSEGRPTGINVLDFDSATGNLTLVRPLDGAPDVSFFAWDAENRRLYVTDEHAGRVGAFSLSADLKTLTALGYQPSEAQYPCYLALSPDRTRLAVANYGSDLVSLFALDPVTGALQPNPQILRGTGNTAEGHAHWVQWSPEGDRLYVVDLGHDEVRVHPYTDGKAGAPQTAFKTPAGAGPRHLAFHPRGFAYLLTEHGSTLIALRREASGALTELQTLSTLPTGFTGKNQCAHISINPAGTMVYVSNRGHNSIGAYTIGADGKLSHLQTIACAGDWPRFFLLLDTHLIAANQESDDLILFAVAADGRLSPTGKTLALSKPVALQPV